ncbi:MAG TPA: hypothetical protein VGB85_02165, partial [Nannocystis sp.]
MACRAFILALLSLGLVGCGGGEAAETATETTVDTGGVTDDPTGPNMCAAEGAGCGAMAHCDPVDGNCYCDPGAYGDPATGCSPHGDLCGEAAGRVDHRVCLHEVTNALDWEGITLGTSKRNDVRKVGKYLVPAHGEAPLPTLFNDSNYYRLHFCMLSEGFEPLFPNWTHPLYNNFVYFRKNRQMYAGSLLEFSGDDLPVRYGFTVQTPEGSDEL